MSLPAKNLLSSETSPYLLQHKDNPVFWRPWSQAALAEAKDIGKPILLSIGYAACHWCHVMAHECFEDKEVADVMNRLFVNIKVDREERPDIDQIFMAALAATGEQGGWPLTMFLTPDGKPFWGGTYFPKQPRYGRPGFIQVMEQVAAALTAKADAVNHNANVLLDHVRNRLAATGDAVEPELRHLASLAEGVAGMIDREAGGFAGAPKFPSAPFMESLWIHALTARNLEHRTLATDSLREMAKGGIYDHLAGGLCRYATDSQWLVPHFEKMLYDNAYFIRHCIWAHAATGDDMFRHRIEQTISWLETEMCLPTGAFASSLDADSEGEEGRFYVWTAEEVRETLGGDSDRFMSEYDISDAGNWEGRSILHRRHDGVALPEDDPLLSAMRARLLNHRNSRIRPGLDDKVLTDWNGLAIRAIAEAGRYFNRTDWLELALGAYDFIRHKHEEGRLPHSIGSGSSLFPAMSSDYAAMILAAIALFEAGCGDHLIGHASNWASMLEKWHGDGDGGFYLTASDANDVPVRIRGDSDDAIASSTSLVIEAIHRLALVTGDITRANHVLTMIAKALGRAAQFKYGQAGLVNSAALALQPLKLIVQEKAGGEIETVANRIPDPRRIDIVAVRSREIAATLPDGSAVPNTPGAYLCIGPVCLAPVTDKKELEKILRDPRA